MAAKKKKSPAKPRFDLEFYHEDGWPRLPDFLNRKLAKKTNDQHSKKTKKQKAK